VRAYIRAIVAKQVAELFHEPDAETVLSWWIANEGRKPVSELATDTYLLIHTQRRLGEAEAEAKARRDSHG